LANLLSAFALRWLEQSFELRTMFAGKHAAAELQFGEPQNVRGKNAVQLLHSNLHSFTKRGKIAGIGPSLEGVP
jgi:hypothetical protein